MPKYLANENVPAQVIEAARQAGHDLAWIVELSPGADDDAVLAAALAESRVLLTLDKDFGEMAFRQGKSATCGVILFRLRVRSPAYVARFVLNVLAQEAKWEGSYSVAQEGKLRIVPLGEASIQKRGKSKRKK